MVKRTKALGITAPTGHWAEVSHRRALLTRSLREI